MIDNRRLLAGVATVLLLACGPPRMTEIYAYNEGGEPMILRVASDRSDPLQVLVPPQGGGKVATTSGYNIRVATLATDCRLIAQLPLVAGSTSTVLLDHEGVPWLTKLDAENEQTVRLTDLPQTTDCM